MMDRNVPTLPPDVFASVVTALADTLIRDYRERWSRGGPEPSTRPGPSTEAIYPAWLKIAEAAKRAQCGEATIRREVRAGRLRAVKVGGRRSLRFRADWVDDWLQAGSTPR
jgi:excisionase family DNA binding protein